MNDIIIQAYSNRKLSKKTVDIGNMQENQVTKLIFELDKDIVALGGNVYLFVTYAGSTYPYPLTNNTFEVGRELTQRKKTDANLVVSTSTDSNNVLDGVVWISNTLTLLVDKNSINIESINEVELPPSLKIVYDNLLNLEKDLQEKRDSDYWRGEKGDKGDAGSVKFVVVNELPTEGIDESAIYLLQIETDEEQNKFLEYIYVDGSWECIGSASVEVDLADYIKNPKPANNSLLGFKQGGKGEVEALGYTNYYPFAHQFCKLADESMGDTIQGTGYTLANTPTRPYHTANKKYVDELFGAYITDIANLVGGDA